MTPAGPEPDRRRLLAVLGVSTLARPSAMAAASDGVGVTATAPAAPTDLSATVSDTPDGNGYHTVDVSWGPPIDDGGDAITLFEHGLWEGGFMRVSGTQLSTTTSYLESPGELTFRVRAENSVGWGPYAELPVTIPVTPA